MNREQFVCKLEIRGANTISLLRLALKQLSRRFGITCLSVEKVRLDKTQPEHAFSGSKTPVSGGERDETL
jgi:hypothetical protein